MGPPPAVAAVRLAVRREFTSLEPGDVVLVACSGGADSLALAAATAFEAPRAGLRAAAVTVDHGLQFGSAERAEELVGRLGQLGLDPVEAVRVEVGTAGGPEAAARTARYAALEDAADLLGAAVVLLGHTRDDQAETVLLGLARGSGARSLAGMAAASGRYRRPLLGLARREVREACLAEGMEPWDDPHNADSAYARVRVRDRILPLLEAELGGGSPDAVARALARTAALLRDDADALDGWAERAFADARSDGPPGGVALAVEALQGMPAAVRARVLRTAALRAGAPANELTAAHVGALDDLVRAWRGQGPLHLPGRLHGRRSEGTVILEPAT